MKKSLLPATFLIACLCGCDSSHDSNTEQPGMTGSDRDEHGCIGSAGYQWCEKLGECARPWELEKSIMAEEAGEFDFEAYCKSD